eukprot:gnl/Dysnectes_brevis/2563_a3087_1024.p1 GENE.gnl/Dysnectes_brevis/2563_a3087_1024~~gnl/Dysnectes_brevis/2563_a3087_1024.p1  ORF type:complete len:456 (+),score=66.02 gnl/Dysnectes_brevis/2563_a3087_1024:66-1433(+)
MDDSFLDNRKNHSETQSGIQTVPIRHSKPQSRRLSGFSLFLHPDNLLDDQPDDSFIDKRKQTFSRRVTFGGGGLTTSSFAVDYVSPTANRERAKTARSTKRRPSTRPVPPPPLPPSIIDDAPQTRTIACTERPASEDNEESFDLSFSGIEDVDEWGSDSERSMPEQDDLKHLFRPSEESDTDTVSPRWIRIITTHAPYFTLLVLLFFAVSTSVALYRAAAAVALVMRILWLWALRPLLITCVTLVRVAFFMVRVVASLAVHLAYIPVCLAVEEAQTTPRPRPKSVLGRLFRPTCRVAQHLQASLRAHLTKPTATLEEQFSEAIPTRPEGFVFAIRWWWDVSKFAFSSLGGYAAFLAMRCLQLSCAALGTMWRGVPSFLRARPRVTLSVSGSLALLLWVPGARNAVWWGVSKWFQVTMVLSGLGMLVNSGRVLFWQYRKWRSSDDDCEGEEEGDNQ